MQGLARFIMRGRPQALLVAVLGSASLLFSWVSAAAIALVTLRRGAAEGAFVLLWALLPAAVIAWSLGDGSYLALLGGTAALAMVLRVTVSLATAILASVGVALLAGGLMLALGEQYLALVSERVVEPYMVLREEALAAAGNPMELPRPGSAAIAGLMGSGVAVMSLLSLMLGRYWQAALYNPGGFGAEFRALRYPLAVSAGLVVALLVLSGQGLAWSIWAMVAVVPLTFAGLGLVHARARLRGWSRGAMWLFYGAWLLVPMQLVMVGLAVADSALDLRRRWEPGESGQ